MAKKKEAATPEQRLQEALVPESEWPYQLPENWCWTYIRSGYDVTSSKRVHKNDWLSNGIPFYRTRELVKLSTQGFVDNELFISEDIYDSFKKDYGVPEQGDLLISGVGTIGVPYVVNSAKKFYFKDGNVIWFKDKRLFLPQYTYYLYKSQFIDNQIHNMSSGTTVDTYTIINASSTKIPLPPLPEQQRIVERIESLFAKLDEAKEKAQAALDSFEPRKAAILHKAFTGELTAKWRREHGVGMERWKNAQLKTLIQLLSGQDFSPDKYNACGEGIPYITGASNFEGSHVLINRWTSQPTVISKKEDVLLVCKGSGFGKTTIADFDEAHIARQIMALRVSNAIVQRFLLYFLQNSIEYIRENGKGLIPGISRKVVLDMEISLPSIVEQAEIVRILDSLLTKEQQAKEASEAVLEQIGITKKAILARAFRGELGTNNPTEESSVSLLKTILEK